LKKFVRVAGLSVDMVFKLRIDGVESKITEFAIPVMSLSSARTNMDRREFEIQVDVGELLTRLEENYKQWVSESRDDDAQCGSPQDELAEAGYPELREVLQRPRLLNLVVGRYLFDKLLLKSSVPTEKTFYWFDKVTECQVQAGHALIRGHCYCQSSISS